MLTCEHDCGCSPRPLRRSRARDARHAAAPAPAVLVLVRVRLAGFRVDGQRAEQADMVSGGLAGVPGQNLMETFNALPVRIRAM